MKLIVGLGNPGKEYEMTRHNIGFMVIDHIVASENLGGFKEDFFGAYIKANVNGETYIFYKPYTYMNDSGRGIRAIVDFYKIKVEDILIIHDDLDLECGYMRLRKNGSSGGHNGIKSIIANLNTEEFKRCRIGIKKINPHIDTIDYVLGHLTDEEKPLIKNALMIAKQAILSWSNNTFDKVMSLYNKKQCN